MKLICIHSDLYNLKSDKIYKHRSTEGFDLLPIVTISTEFGEQVAQFKGDEWQSIQFKEGEVVTPGFTGRNKMGACAQFKVIPEKKEGE